MSQESHKWFETEKAPDYSFDRFVKSAEDLKHTKDSMVGAAKEKEAEIDKEVDKKKKEADKEKDKPVEPEDKNNSKDQPKDKPKDPVEFDDNQKNLLGQLRKIAKERSEKKEQK